MSSLNQLKALNDRVIFKFLQDTTGNMFQEKTKHGLIVVEGKDKQLNCARWAKVYQIGKDVSSEVKVGSYILIEALMWTTHQIFNGEKFWVTSEEKIFAVADENPMQL